MRTRWPVQSGPKGWQSRHCSASREPLSQPPLLAEFLPLFRRSLAFTLPLFIEFIEHFAEVLAILLAELLRANEVGEERSQVALEQFVRGLLKPFIGQIFALQN